jgi:hypothetical protein
MKRVIALALGIGFATLATTSSAGAPPLARLFPMKADVVAPSPPGEWVELELPPDVITACRPDLADVRLVGAGDAQVPFAIETRPSGDADRPKEDRIVADIIGVEHHSATPIGPLGSGAKVAVREFYELSLPAGSPLENSSTDPWELIVQSDRTEYVRKVRVFALGPKGRRPLATDGQLFRLADNGAQRNRIALTGDPTPKLLVLLDGLDSAFLEPNFSLERARRVDGEPPLYVHLETLRNASAASRTEIVLARPAGIVPSALRLATSTALFERRLRVLDEGGPAAGAVLGTEVVYRGRAAPPAESLIVPIERAKGQRLRIAIDDGDSPPLADIAIDVVVARPVLRIPASAWDRGNVTMLFGGGRVRKPAYDILPIASPREGVAEEPRRAHLDHVRDNDAFDATPALGWAMHAGAAIDRRAYRYVHGVSLQPSADGLSRLALEPADCAQARPDGADVRLVDASGAQWPYLLETDAEGRWVDLAPGAREAQSRSTRTRYALPSRPLSVSAVELDVRDAYFHRPARISGLDENGQTLRLWDGELSHEARDEVRSLEIRFPEARVVDVQLEIDNGDNAALDVRAARARVAQPVLYIAAPAGNYSLFLGNPDIAPASYDIQPSRDVVLAVASEPGTLDAFGPNPAYRSPSRFPLGKTAQDIALWSVLVLSTLLLGGLTLRLARAPDAPPGAG